jgi:hypothetical protein
MQVEPEDGYNGWHVRDGYTYTHVYLVGYFSLECFSLLDISYWNILTDWIFLTGIFFLAAYFLLKYFD